MEKIKKVGEITCNNVYLTNWVEKNLENTGFIVRVRITSDFDCVFEIYEKTE